MKSRTTNGVLYTEDLAGPNGVAIVLFPDEKHTKRDLATARHELKSQRDVVRIHVADDWDWDYMYKGEIFKDQRTKNLKWYEIEQDEKIIRRERKKGTTPEDFVTHFVLPFVVQTHGKFLAKHGKSIYGI